MSDLVNLTLVFIAVMLILAVVLRVANRLEQRRHNALRSQAFAGSKDAEFAAAIEKSFVFYVAQHDQRATAMVAALEAAIEFGKYDWFGVGNEKAQRAYNNAQQMLRKSQAKLEAKDYVAAQEFARLGQELLKTAYMRSHG